MHTHPICMPRNALNQPIQYQHHESQKKGFSRVDMKLVMEVFTGHLFYVEVEEGTTVADLKAKIGAQENFPRRRLILMLDTGEERILLDNDAARLGDSGIQDSSHIYIFFGIKPRNNEEGYGDDDSSHNAHSTPLSPKEPFLSHKEVVSGKSCEDALNEQLDHDEKPVSASADPNSECLEG